MNTLVEIVKEHVSYRSQITRLAKSDMVRAHKGTVLGWFWELVKPSIRIFVFWFAFTYGLRGGGPINGYPFFLWLTIGLVPWFGMRDIISGGAKSIMKYSYLVTKMKFPISTIPTFVSISKIGINLFLVFAVILLFWALGYPPDIYLLQLPFYIFCMFTFFTILALFTAPLSAMSKDFHSLVNSFIQPIFWLSGIIWNIENIGVHWIQKVLMFNPVTFICTGFRNCFINKVWFFEQPKRLMYFAIITLIVFVLALISYKKFRKELPDVL